MKMRTKRKLPRKNDLYLPHPGSDDYIWRKKVIMASDSQTTRTCYILHKYENFGEDEGRVLCWDTYLVERRDGIWVCGSYRFYDCDTPIPECETMVERLMFAMTLRKLGGE